MYIYLSTHALPPYNLEVCCPNMIRVKGTDQQISFVILCSQTSLQRIRRNICVESGARGMLMESFFMNSPFNPNNIGEGDKIDQSFKA